MRGWGRLESSPWPRSLHREEISTQPTKQKGFRRELSSLPLGQGHLFVKLLGPYRCCRLLRSCPGRSLRSADYSVHVDLRSELKILRLQSVSYQPLGLVQR